MPEPGAETKSTSWRTLGWSFYLACSWTWCIGMFLPVLMVRDYGVWGFVVFAIPNVIGAGAFAWVLRTPEASAALVALHAPAMRAFSMVTIAFHLFFLLYALTWLGPLQGGLVPLAWMPASVVVLLLVGAAGVRGGGTARMAVAAWVLSVLAFVVAWAFGGLDTSAFARAHADGPAPGLLWLAPVCVIGFTLCPYLDLTFHRTRQACEGASGRAAFGVGFGVLFVVMILLTPGYASLFDPPGFRDWTWPAFLLTALPILVHGLNQAYVTSGWHLERLVSTGSKPVAGTGRRSFKWVAGTVVLLFVLYPVLALAPAYKGMALGEVIYRCFMGFYGLVFPAYVWLLMVPTRDGHSGLDGRQGRWKLRVLWLAVGIAAPMFWLGFVEGREVWLGPGVLVVLAARAVAAGGRARPGIDHA